LAIPVSTKKGQKIVSLYDRIVPAPVDSAFAHYERDGVVCLRGLFDRDEMELLDETCRGAAASPSPSREVCEEVWIGGEKRRFYLESGLVRFASFVEFLVNSAAAKAAGRTMSSTVVRYFADQLIIKDPGVSKPTPWHQDLPYWPLCGRRLCSMWIPVDPVSAGAGMHFVPGSHLWNEYSPRDFATGQDFGQRTMASLPEIDVRFGYRIVACDLERGDCLLFHAMIVHGAAGNLTERPRRAFSIRWAGDDVTHFHRPANTPRRAVGKLERNGLALEDEDYPVLWRAGG
jgi:ectoine hydroxylase-related dioxygenase (phytanoyl-CoA dioxygenase family)